MITLLKCQKQAKVGYDQHYRLVMDVLWKLLGVNESDLEPNELAEIKYVIKEFDGGVV